MILGIRSLFMSYPKEQGMMMLYAYTVIFILLGIYSGNRGVLFINSLVWILLTLFLWKKQGKKNQKLSQRLQRHKVLLILTLFFSTVFVIFSILVHKRTLTTATPCPPPKQQIKTLKKEKLTSEKTNPVRFFSSSKKKPVKTK
jgi:membrane-bound ClpP family serine protease